MKNIVKLILVSTSILLLLIAIMLISKQLLNKNVSTDFDVFNLLESKDYRLIQRTGEVQLP